LNGGDLAYDAAPPNVEVQRPDGGGHTWTDLYRDFFGPTGVASCAGNGHCHGDPSQPGAQASFYVCAPPASDAGVAPTAEAGSNADAALAADAVASEPDSFAAARAACLDSMKSAGLVAAGTAFSDSRLYSVLRKESGGGYMPQSPPYSFSADDIQRMTDWVAAGANND
jgi:hypothetical protein